MESSVIQAIVLGSRDALLDALERGGNPDDAENSVPALTLVCLQDSFAMPNRPRCPTTLMRECLPADWSLNPDAGVLPRTRESCRER
jgi:hypothetical protein